MQKKIIYVYDDIRRHSLKFCKTERFVIQNHIEVYTINNTRVFIYIYVYISIVDLIQGVW